MKIIHERLSYSDNIIRSKFLSWPVSNRLYSEVNTTVDLCKAHELAMIPLKTTQEVYVEAMPLQIDIG